MFRIYSLLATAATLHFGQPVVAEDRSSNDVSYSVDIDLVASCNSARVRVTVAFPRNIFGDTVTFLLTKGARIDSLFCSPAVFPPAEWTRGGEDTLRVHTAEAVSRILWKNEERRIL